MTGTGVFNSNARVFQNPVPPSPNNTHPAPSPSKAFHPTNPQSQRSHPTPSPPQKVLLEKAKVLPPEESLPRGQVLGGYIFVCNNDTMQEDLRRQLFGLPQRYRDSVRTIRPGLPLFLYNYTTHQLHGMFEATSFGGSNLDPTAWEDKKCKGESRFPAQVRIRVRKMCRALEEEEFRPFLHHYDGPKFRLELTVPETLALLDIFDQNAVQFPYPGLRVTCKDDNLAPRSFHYRRALA